MTMKTNKIVVLIAIIFAVTISFKSYSQEEKTLCVVSINDQHGNIDNYPQFAFIVDSLRQKYPNFLLVSAGDNRTGNPINDHYHKNSYPIVALMNELNFDLSALGNHEFDSGVKALKDVTEWANFDFICSNAYFDEDFIKPYKIIEIDGLKIGFLAGIQLGYNGIPDFNPSNAKNVSFRSIIDILPEYMNLREECNALFLLSHCGFESDVEIAKQFPQFDAIFGGHTHTKIERTKKINEVLLTQAGSKLNYLTFSLFYFEDGKIVYKVQKLIKINGYPNKNEKVQARVDEFNNDKTLKKIVGYNDDDISRKESLGCFMTDIIRYCAKADIAMQNPGGVRYSKLPLGNIFLKDIYGIDPFNNNIVEFTLSGEEIVDILKNSYKINDNKPTYISGCSYTIIKNDYEEVEDIIVTLDNGEPLDMNANYEVVMNSYMAKVYNFAKKNSGKTLPATSNEMALKFLKKNKHINYSNVSRIKIEYR